MCLAVSPERVDDADRVLVAERGTDGEWQTSTWREVRWHADRLAQGLLDRGLADRPVMILSGNSRLHLTVTLAKPVDEAALRAECARRRVEISTLSDYRAGAFAESPTLLLGYAQVPEAAIAAGVDELAAAVAAVPQNGRDDRPR